MRLQNTILIFGLLALSACSGSHRPVYSGHEESTAGVPGFDSNGKKLSPNVKLGQSYSVDGETYVPRYEPGYTQEGLASWYGPGFHGGKTANGERYDSSEMTAAHRTLPLPSMVKVTLLSTGKSAIVRINDRGPYAKGRIIDLSKAAADSIGLTKLGTGKVRVEYLDQETRRFTSLMADGRDPKDIDVDEEVLAYVQQHSTPPTTAVADATDVMPAQSPFVVAGIAADDGNVVQPKQQGDSWLSHMNPIPNAWADDAPLTHLDDVNSGDLPPPTLPDATQTVAGSSVVSAPTVATSTAQTPLIVPKGAVRIVPKNSTASMQVTSAAPAPATAAVNATGGFIQLGAFASKANAEALITKIGGTGTASISPTTIANGQPVYRVRMGPYTDADILSKELAKLQARGLDAKPIYE